MSQISKAIAARTEDRSLDAAVDYARKLSASELLPKAYVGKPQNVLLAIEFGRSLGLDPITAINMTHVVQGRPTASAQLVGALVRRAGHILRVRGDETSATAKIVRSDDPEFTFEATWTMERAKQAGVLSNPVWKSYPANMLKARAITEVARDACPEVLAGMGYTSEEMNGPADVSERQADAPNLVALPDGTVIEGETGEIVDGELIPDTDPLADVPTPVFGDQS